MDLCWSLALLLSLISFVLSQTQHRRFEYKYSFKGPYLAQKDNLVPFWTYSGNAIASEESVRITPSLRSQKGQIWTKNPTNFEWWEVDVVFRVTGRGRIGADGLAIWFTDKPGVEGPVFGSSDQWNGLGVFFDSFDNDNKRNNPYVMAMVNDGTKVYDHEHDGLSQQLGGCLRDFRNKPFPVRAKIEYYKNVLTLMIHNGMTNNEKDYEICMRAENVYIPPSGYFGITAATGGLADDHDVLKFLVTSLRSPEEMAVMQANAEEEERFRREFQEYQEKTKKARDEYVAQNPDSIRKEAEEEYETGEQRELRQIFQGQGQIHDLIRNLHAKLDEIIGRQERTLGLVSAVHSGMGGQVAPTGQVPPAQVGALPGDTIRRHEVDSILNNQRDIVATARDIKNFVNDIHQKSNQLLTNSQKPQGSVQPVGYDLHVTLNEMKEGLNIVKRDLGTANQRLTSGPAGGCPPVSCVSTGMFITFMVIQVVLLIGYIVYRGSSGDSEGCLVRWFSSRHEHFH
ncbi:protein ERGIC-53 isoform X1 [Penaeus vannamei]|uniref:Lectin, mannose-binding, 1 n=1 Tax=Penaeus vannamei TaxID=6689 RepID=A0A423SFQ4_PENVA|nr:protein ERGIC-53-like isoform X3 [Penaeus vannamei]ROT63057.1 lectin, mannose-binding, 1 [Penaeus vannamei]